MLYGVGNLTHLHHRDSLVCCHGAGGSHGDREL